MAVADAVIMSTRSSATFKTSSARGGLRLLRNFRIIKSSNGMVVFIAVLMGLLNWTPPVIATPILLTTGQPIDFYSYNHIFAFGDSYTATGYDPANGINNITYFGNTSSNGLNWFQFLALSNPSINASRQLFDMAQFGATASNLIVQGATLDLVDQVNEFHSYFVPPPAQAAWSSNDTLFAIWIGINDVGFGFTDGIYSSDTLSRINATWLDTINKLYSYGARDFLVLGIPPTEKTPLVQQGFNSTNITLFGNDIAQYNSMLTSFIPYIPLNYPGTKAMLFDTQPFFNALIEDPYRYGFVDSTTVCPAYELVTADPFVDSPLCPWPFTEMVWASSYHPTWRVHQLLSQVLLNALQTAKAGGVLETETMVLSNGSITTLDPTYIPIATPSVTASRSVADPTVELSTAIASATAIIGGKASGKTSGAVPLIIGSAVSSSIVGLIIGCALIF